MRCLVFTVALTLVIPKIQREFNELIDIWQFSSDILLGINSHITLNCATIGGSISVQCHNVVETRRLLCYVTVKGGQYVRMATTSNEISVCSTPLLIEHQS